MFVLPSIKVKCAEKLDLKLGWLDCPVDRVLLSQHCRIADTGVLDAKTAACSTLQGAAIDDATMFR